MKKSRVEPTSSTGEPDVFDSETVPADLEHEHLQPRRLFSGETGQTPDEFQRMKLQYEKLLRNHQVLKDELAATKAELSSLKSSPPEGTEPGHEGGGNGQQADPTLPASDEAARKRLARICSPKADGKHVDMIQCFCVLLVHKI